MQTSVEDRNDVFCSIITELKTLGLKVPKSKKLSKQAKPVSAISSSSSKIFGVCISEQEQVQLADYSLPKFVATSTSYLKKFTEKQIGMFRIQGSVSRQRKLRVKLEEGGNIEESEPNDVASLLKQWLRELPVSLVPSYLQNLFVRCLNLQVEENKIKALILCCQLLPTEHLHTLKHLLDFLKDIADNSDRNKMNACNLSLIMAPNIFVNGTDFIDKSSTNLVQQHACVIEVLINNVHLIKNSHSSLHLAEVEDLQCNSDLNDVSDFYPTKSTKKRSSGPVQDLFRKLVNQSSASKRKTEPDEFPMSPLKKVATSSNVSQNETLNYTPNNKSIQSFFKMKNKTSSKQSQRTPFGILKKDKKRQKSVKPSTSVENNFAGGTPYPFKDKLEESLKAGALEASFGNSSPTLSSIDFEKLFSKSLSVKKSVSGYLTVPQEAFENKHLFSTYSSEGCLQLEGNKQSPYYLRSNSKKSIKQKSDKINVKPEEILEIVYKDEDNNGLSCSPWFNRRNSKTSPRRSPKELILTPEDVNKLSIIDTGFSTDSATLNSSFGKIDFGDFPETAVNKSSLKNEDSECIEESASLSSVSKIQKPVDSGALMRSDITDVNNMPSVLKEPNLTSESSLQSGETIRRKCSVSQETLEVKSVSRKKTLRSSQLKRADSIKLSKSKSSCISQQNINLNCNCKNDGESALPVTSTSEVNLAKTNKKAISLDIPDKKRTRRNVRSKSIIRGRPNTVQTGLRSDVCSRYNKGRSESFAANSKHQLCASTSVDNELFINFENNAHSMSITLQIQNKTSPQEEKSAKNINAKNVQNSVSGNSANTATDHRRASAVITVIETKVKEESDTAGMKSNTGTETKTAVEVDVKSDAIAIQTKTATDSAKVRRSASGKRERERLCSNSDSKIHKMKKRSSTISRINSFPESGKKLKPRNAKKLRAVKSSSPKKPRKKEITDSCEVEKENVYVQESSKTQSSNFSVPKTPESMQAPVVWISGKEFFENGESQEETNHKRESIAMILKNNTGHVKAKVNLYDYRSRSCSVTPVMPRSSIHGARSYDPQYSDMQIRQSQKRSASVRSNKLMRRNSPLPPPPKFFISESSPLKELTNISNSEDIVFSPSPAKMAHGIQNNDKTFKKPNKNCTLQPKRNSFSGHTPLKLPTGSKVFRSESSPLLSKNTLAKKLQESSTTNKTTSLKVSSS